MYRQTEFTDTVSMRGAPWCLRVHVKERSQNEGLIGQVKLTTWGGYTIWEGRMIFTAQAGSFFVVTDKCISETAFHGLAGSHTSLERFLKSLKQFQLQTIGAQIRKSWYPSQADVIKEAEKALEESVEDAEWNLI